MKLLLACNAGMSTSLLVQKMQKEVAERGLALEIEATPLGKAMGKIKEFDAVLLGPQIGYAKGDAEKASGGTVPVAVIPMTDYGRMNAQGIIDMALGLMEAK